MVSQVQSEATEPDCSLHLSACHSVRNVHMGLIYLPVHVKNIEDEKCIQTMFYLLQRNKKIAVND